jgi:hypothetical protein
LNLFFSRHHAEEHIKDGATPAKITNGEPKYPFGHQHSRTTQHPSLLLLLTMMLFHIVTLLLASILSVDALSRQAGGQTFSRRQILASAGPVAVAALVSEARPAGAATTPPSADELSRIQIGYQQIQELLNNFDEATTVCRENGGECKRDAEPIRECDRL